jgi:hypothetical protein
MTQTTAEVMLIIPLVFFLSVLVFLSGPLRSVMNKMDRNASKQFISLLFTLGQRSAFLLTVTNISVLAAIPYYIVYGFNNVWFTVGIVVFLVAASVAKIVKLPLYKKITLLDANTAEWADARQKMHVGNILQALFTFIAVCIMTASLFR